MVSTGEETQLTWDADVELWPSVSPEGKQLLFQLIRDPGSGRRLPRSRLICKPVDEPGKQITLATEAFDAKWSPAGDRIAFVRGSEGRSDIWTIDPTGGNEKRVTPNGMIPAGFSYKPYNRAQSYDWSPDGSKIAYCSLRSGVLNVYSVSSDGSNEVTISHNSNPGLLLSSVRWSRDGRSLAYVSLDAPDKNGARLSAVWVSSG